MSNKQSSWNAGASHASQGLGPMSTRGMHHENAAAYNAAYNKNK
ncbi:MAG: hypothetical protein AAFQ58_08265 [Pseudomonadota bacterium]